MRRHDHRLDAQLARNVRGVKRPGAAESEQRELTRIVASIDRDEPRSTRHVVVCDCENRCRSLLGRETERVADRLREPSTQPLQIGIGGGRCDARGVDPPEQHVGISDRRLLAAAPVTERARAGAR